MFSHVFECKSWFYHDRPVLFENQELRLQQELENVHDPYAVEIFTKADEKVGYIPASINRDVCALLNKNTQLYIKVTSPFDEDLETPPLLLLQDLESRLATETESQKDEAREMAKTKRWIIFVLVVILLDIGGCVAMCSK